MIDWKPIDTIRQSRDAWRSIAEDGIREAKEKLEAARVAIAERDATIAELRRGSER